MLEKWFHHFSNTTAFLFEKIWKEHIVAQEEDSPTILYIDLHLIHEVTSPQAFTGLRQRGIKVRRPGKVMATMDHCTPTSGISIDEMADPIGRTQLKQLIKNCKEFGIELYKLGSPENGIVHVVAPEQGLTQPGMTREQLIIPPASMLIPMVITGSRNIYYILTTIIFLHRSGKIIGSIIGPARHGM